MGKVLEAKNHQDADKLYVETVDVGDAEPRTVRLLLPLFEKLFIIPNEPSYKNSS